jgi:hypothetical protein
MYPKFVNQTLLRQRAYRLPVRCDTIDPETSVTNYHYSLRNALRYEPEGRRINSEWFHWNFSLT